MDEQTNPTPAPATDSADATTEAKMYPTKQDAENARPANAHKTVRAFEVSKNGTSLGWCLARGHANAVEMAARLVDKYSASTGVKAAPVTKEAAKAKVLEMSDEEFKALVAARRAAKK